MQTLGVLGVLWGLVGISLLLSSAVVRLLPKIHQGLSQHLGPLQMIVLFFWCAFMLVAEGYRGFQKQFAPRVAGRLVEILEHPKLIYIVLAPMYAMSYFAAPRRRIITSWCVTAGVILLILIVRQFSQPWRGIIDTGVVLGLGYGLVAIYVHSFKALRTTT